MMPKDASAVVTAAGVDTLDMSSMLAQSLPKRGSAAFRQSMGTNPYNPTGHSVAPQLAGLKEEVHPLWRPSAACRGGGEPTCSSDSFLKMSEEVVEVVDVCWIDGI